MSIGNNLTKRRDDAIQQKEYYAAVRGWVLNLVLTFASCVSCDILNLEKPQFPHLWKGISLFISYLFTIYNVPGLVVNSQIAVLNEPW